MNDTRADIPAMLLAQREAAVACRLCEKSLYLAVRRGELRAVKIGRAVRYDSRDLATWIEHLKGGDKLLPTRIGDSGIRRR